MYEAGKPSLDATCHLIENLTECTVLLTWAGCGKLTSALFVGDGGGGTTDRTDPTCDGALHSRLADTVAALRQPTYLLCVSVSRCL